MVQFGKSSQPQAESLLETDPLLFGTSARLAAWKLAKLAGGFLCHDL
jgi:hypothetical protein